jgi:hypothetical protein
VGRLAKIIALSWPTCPNAVRPTRQAAARTQNLIIHSNQELSLEAFDVKRAVNAVGGAWSLRAINVGPMSFRGEVVDFYRGCVYRQVVAGQVP